MSFDPSKVAKVKVSASADLAAIVRAAGGDPAHAILADGYLTVRGIDQAALVAAAEPADPLYAMRAAIKASARTELQRRVNSGLPFRGKLADMDEEQSIPRLTGAVTGALVAQAQAIPLTITWRMADNTGLALDGAGLIALGQLVLAYFQMLNGHYWSLVDAAQAAPDLATLAAIDPLAGWPDPPAEPASPP